MARVPKPKSVKKKRVLLKKNVPPKKNVIKKERTRKAKVERPAALKGKIKTHPVQAFDTARILKTIGVEKSHERPKSIQSSRPFPGHDSEALPDNYGDNLIYAMIRDPYWIFVYWELQSSHIENVLRSLKSSQAHTVTILRVYDLSACAQGTCFFDIRLESLVQSWYIQVAPGQSYVVEIGLLHKDGRFAALARSNRVDMPQAGVSSVLDEKWASQDMEKIYAASSGAGRSGVNGQSSEEIYRMLEDQLLLGISSGSGAGILSGVSSASGKSVQRSAGKQRQFRFVLDCEVIVYGATEPDARVTLQGREMKLRPDGTFTARFALPDGKFVFEAKAFSADGIEERTITPTVQRDTERPAPVIKGNGT